VLPIVSIRSAETRYDLVNGPESEPVLAEPTKERITTTIVTINEYEEY